MHIKIKTHNDCIQDNIFVYKMMNNIIIAGYNNK